MIKNTMAMKKILFVSLAFSMMIMTGCAGKTAQVLDQSIGEGIIKKNFGIKKHEVITFSTVGKKIYTGRPSTLVFYGYSVSVNLDAIQKVSAKHVLGSIYDNVQDAGKSSRIISEITDFKYKWPAFSFSSNAIVSFKVHFIISDKEGRVATKGFSVNEFKGSDNKTFWAGALFSVVGASLSGNVDERSQMVTNATLEALNQIYEKQLVKVIKEEN